LATYHLGQFIVQTHREFSLPTTISIAKMAADVFKTRHLGPSVLPTGARDAAFIAACEQSYHGGKHGLYVAPGVDKDGRAGDIAAAYAHAMANLPPMTRGQWERVTECVPGAAAIYRVRGRVRDRCPYGMFLLDPKGTKLHAGDFECWVTGYELESAWHEID